MKIGIMSFAHTHAVGYAMALRDVPGVELLASDPGEHDPAEVRGSELANELGVPYADDYEDLLAWGPDAVIVTSENARHRELVELAAAAGAHILCEKPLATSWEDGLAIRRAVEDAGVILMVAFPVRFASQFARIQAHYSGGALGEVYAIRGANNGMLPLQRAWFTQPELSGGGALVDHIVHIADMTDALLNAEPVRVTAVANRVLHAERARAETAGLVSIEYDGGTVAAIDCSWSQADTAPVWGGLKLSVAGTGGTVDIDFFGPAARGIQATTGRAVELRYGPNFDAAMLHAFIDAVAEGRQPEPSVEVGLRTLSIVLAAQESVRTGRTVAISEVTA